MQLVEQKMSKITEEWKLLSREVEEIILPLERMMRSLVDTYQAASDVHAAFRAMVKRDPNDYDYDYDERIKNCYRLLLKNAERAQRIISRQANGYELAGAARFQNFLSSIRENSAHDFDLQAKADLAAVAFDEDRLKELATPVKDWECP